jgi:hypothetical protein
MSVYCVSVIFDDPVANLALEGRRLHLATAVLVLVFAPLQVVLRLEEIFIFILN